MCKPCVSYTKKMEAKASFSHFFQVLITYSRIIKLKRSSLNSLLTAVFHSPFMNHKLLFPINKLQNHELAL